MVHKCIVPNCKSTDQRNDKGIHLYVFPKDHRFEIWAAACGRNNLEIKNRRNYRICNLHFDKESTFETSEHNQTNLKKNAIPTLQLQIEKELPNNEPCEIASTSSFGVKRSGAHASISPEMCTQVKIQRIQNSPKTTENVEKEKTIENDIKNLSEDYNQKSINSAIVDNGSDKVNENSNDFKLDEITEILIQPKIHQIYECTAEEILNGKCTVCLKLDARVQNLTSSSQFSEFKELFKYLGIEDWVNSVCSYCVLQMRNILKFKRQCEESKNKLGLFNLALTPEKVIFESYEVQKTKIESKTHSMTSDLEFHISIPISETIQTLTPEKEELHKVVHSEIKQKNNTKRSEEMCVICNENFSDKIWLRRHQILVHGLKNCILECYQCYRQYFRKTYKSKLRLHNENQHENICKVCNLKFQTLFHLAKHRLLHASDMDATDTQIIEKHKVKSSHRKKVACVLCNKVFSSEYYLHRHLKKPHKVPCTRCKRSVYNLSEHLKRHLNRPPKKHQKDMESSNLKFLRCFWQYSI